MSWENAHNIWLLPIYKQRCTKLNSCFDIILWNCRISMTQQFSVHYSLRTLIEIFSFLRLSLMSFLLHKGGGVYISNGSIVTMTSCTVSNNSNVSSLVCSPIFCAYLQWNTIVLRVWCRFTEHKYDSSISKERDAFWIENIHNIADINIPKSSED